MGAAGAGDHQVRIGTGEDIRMAREELGWSVYTLARALRMSGERGQSGRRIREYESGAKEPPGPTTVAIEALVDGFRPAGWTAVDG